MSTFATAMTTAYASIVEQFGEASVYVDPDDAEETELAQAVWNERPDAEIRHQHGTDRNTVATVLVIAAELAAPESGATIERTATGQTWTVDAVERLSGAFRLTVTRYVTVERAGETYRTPRR